MAVEWYSSDSKDGYATICDSNITLNKNILRNIETAYSVMLGIDKDNLRVVIRALTKDQDIRGDIPETQKYKITIRSSYGRISNKDFIKRVSKMSEISFIEPIKFKATWDDDEHLIYINLKESE